MEKTLSAIADLEGFITAVEILILQGNWEAVRDKAERRREACPGDGAACLALALCVAREGRKEEALRHLEAMERIEEGWGLFYRYGGDMFARQGMIREAMESYRKSSLLNSGKVRWIDRDGPREPRDLRGGEDFGDEEKGEDNATIPEEILTPTMADLYIRQGHYELARSVLKKLLSGDPGNGPLRESLGKLEETIRERQNRRERVLGELSHWLGRLEKRKTAAAPGARSDA